MKSELPALHRSVMEYIFFRSPEEIQPEQAQALTRVGITFVVVLGLLGYELMSGFASRIERIAAILVFTYLLLGIVHYLLVRRFPETRPWRLYALMASDHAMVSMGIYILGPIGAIFYPLYLWISVGNGLRFGVHYLYVATAISVPMFLGSALSNPAWSSQPQLVIGLTIGMIIMPLFFIALLRQLEKTNSQLQKQINEAEHRATHDDLTDLPNRALLEDRLGYGMANVERFGPEIAVFLIDIDSFKTINDTYGHFYGDQLLKQVASRMQDCLRSFDTLARLGGDEFIVLLQGSHLITHAASVADRMAEYVSGHYHNDGLDVFVTISIGIALYPNDGTTVETMIKNADTAMNRAKAEGGSRYRFYDTHMSHEVEEQLVKQVELRKALQNREFRLYFQPRIDTASKRIVGAEALIRWEHPKHGILEPGEFIPAAEESGMIISLDKWLLDAVCREIAGWQKDGLPALHTTVNVSGRQFMEKDYASYLRKIIDLTHIDPHHLGLEITEGVLIEHTEQVNAVFKGIKSLGVLLLLDDFGTRYSSLSYLKRFPIDTLKIDRSFIQDIPVDPDDCALVEAMISIAHSLRMDVVAEGVENEAQLAWLQEKKCDSVQGFLVSQPVPASEFRHQIAQHTPIERLSN